MARFRRRRIASRPRRPREWFTFSVADATTGTPTSVQLSTTAFGAPSYWADYIWTPDEMTQNFDEPTILRTIVRGAMISQLAIATNQNLSIYLGLVLLKHENMSSPFSAAQLLTIPEPYFDGDTDWIYNWHFTLNMPVNTQLSALHAIPGAGEADIKTRRKVPNGHGLAMIIGVESSAAHTIRISMHGRMLIAN